MPKLWPEVVASPEFKSLSVDDRTLLRQQYFDDVVLPKISPDDHAAAWSQFDADTVTDINPNPSFSDMLSGFAKSIPSIVDTVMHGGAAGHMENFNASQPVPGVGLEGSFQIPGAGRETFAQGAQQAGAMELDKAAQAIQATQSARPEFGDHWGKEFGFDAAEMIAKMVPGVTTGLLTKNPALAVGAMSGQASAEAYPGRRIQGETPEQAAAGASFTGFAEGATEAIPVGWLFKQGKPLMKRVLDFTVGEGLQEAASSLLQSAYDKGTISPDMTLGDALRSAGYEGALGMAGGATVASAVHPFMAPEGMRMPAVTRGQQAGRILQDAVDGTAFTRTGEQAAFDILNTPATYQTDIRRPDFKSPAMAAGWDDADRYINEVKLSAYMSPEDRKDVRDSGLDVADKYLLIEDETATTEEVSAMEQIQSAANWLHAAGDPLQVAVAMVAEEGEVADPPDFSENLVSAVRQAKDDMTKKADSITTSPHYYHDASKIKATQDNGEWGVVIFEPSDLWSESSYLNNPQPIKLATFGTDELAARAFVYLSALELESPTPAKTTNLDAMRAEQVAAEPWRATREEYVGKAQGQEATLRGEQHRQFVRRRMGEIESQNLEQKFDEAKKRQLDASDVLQAAIRNEKTSVNGAAEFKSADAAYREAQKQVKAADLALTAQDAFMARVRDDYPDLYDSYLLKAADAAIARGNKRRADRIFSQNPGLAAKWRAMQAMGPKNTTPQWAARGAALVASETPFGRIDGKNEMAHEAYKEVTEQDTEFMEGLRDHGRQPIDPADSMAIRTNGEIESKLYAELFDRLEAAGLPEMATKGVRGFGILEAPSSTMGIHIEIPPQMGGGSLIGLNEFQLNELTYRGNDPVAVMSVAHTLAHEIGHFTDSGATVDSPLFEIGFREGEDGVPVVELRGKVIQSMYNASRNGYSALREELLYPFDRVDTINQIIVASNGDPSNLIQTPDGTVAPAGELVLNFMEELRAESFAQLHGLFYTAGRTPSGMKRMRRHMATAIKFMEEIHNVYTNSRTEVERNEGILQVFRVDGSSGSTSEYRLHGVDRDNGEGSGDWGGTRRVEGDAGSGIFGSKEWGQAVVKAKKSTASVKSKTKEVPDSVDAVTALEQSMDYAKAGHFARNRDLKAAMQTAALAAMNQAGVNLSVDSPQNTDYLVRVGVRDALFALKTNANAVGWYDKTVSKAMEILSVIHPELATDEDARFAFTWALAVTSNGIKVDKNFQLAEQAYAHYKQHGKMPTNIKAGNAQKSINKSMREFNELIDRLGIDDLRKFMLSNFTARQIKSLDIKQLKVDGEDVDTVVRGAAILGPKIGNGFFSNLYGHFDQLTMDRWLMRTWGRWTGSLIEERPDMVRAKRKELQDLVRKMKKNKSALAAFESALGMKLTVSNIDAVAARIAKRSASEKTRDVFDSTATGEQLRKVGNSLTKYIDGQKEAPENGTERNRIRKVFSGILAELQSNGYENLTMSDLQALVWYPERRLYDMAKSKADAEVDAGYLDDEAPDYANAAASLARSKGVGDSAIKSAIMKAEADYETRHSAGTARPDEAGTGGRTPDRQAGGRLQGFSRRERARFLKEHLYVPARISRSRNEGTRSYAKPRRGTVGSVRGLIHRPSAGFAKVLGDAEIPPVTLIELESTPENATRFQQAIQASAAASAFGAAVYVYPVEEYQQMRLFQTEDGMSGFAIKPDGDIVSVFSDGGGKAYSMLALAVEQGGAKLDAFNTVLPKIYNVAGFRETSRDKWDDQYMPEGWDKATFKDFNHGEPDIVYMEYDPAFNPYAEQPSQTPSSGGFSLVGSKVQKKSDGSYPLAPRGEWYGDADYADRGGRMVEMSPQEYLSKVRPLNMDEVSRDNIDDLKQHIQAGKTLDPLAIYADGKEDGRHRAQAAAELGINRVPVLLFTKNGPGTLHANPVTAVYRGYQDMAGKTIDIAQTILHPLRPLGNLPNQTTYLKSRYRMMGDISRINEMAERIEATFRDLSEEAKGQVYKYLTTRDAPITVIESATVTVREKGQDRQVSVRARAAAIKRQFNRIGDRLVDLGLVPESSREDYRDAYLPRVYLKHILAHPSSTVYGKGGRLSDQGYLKQRSEIPEEWRRILGEITDPGYLAAHGMSVSMRDLRVMDFLEELSVHREWVHPDYMVEIVTGPDANGTGIRAMMPTDGSRGRRVSVFWAKEEAARLREQARYMEGQPKSEVLQYADDLQGIADSMLEQARVVPDNFRQVPNSKRYGALRGMWVRNEIYNDLIGTRKIVDPDAGLVERVIGPGGTLEKATQAWKIAKVPMNYPTQVRNFLSNMILMQLSGVPMHRVPLRMAQALKEVRTNGKHWRIAKKYGIKEGTFIANEVMKIERELLKIAAQKESATEGLPLAKVADMLAGFVNAHTDLYQASEGLFKTAVIIDAMVSRGMSETDAVLEAHEALFDYSLVPRGVGALRRSIIGMPFITFYYKSAGKMAEVALKHPMRFLPWVLLEEALIGMIMSTFDVDKDDVKALTKALPQWLQDKGHAHFLPVKDEHGRWQAVDVGYLLPWATHTQVIKSVAEGQVREALESTGFLGAPVATLISAVMTGTDPFTKREIMDRNDPPAKQIADMTKYLWRLAAPTIWTDIGATGHVYRAITDQRDTRRAYYGEPTSTLPQALARAVGLNIYPIDPEVSRNENLRRMGNELKAVRSRMRRALRDVDPGMTADEQAKERLEIIEDFQPKMQTLRLQMLQYQEESYIHPHLGSK